MRQQDLADRLGVRRMTVTRLESGIMPRSKVLTDKIEKITRGKVKAADLFVHSRTRKSAKG